MTSKPTNATAETNVDMVYPFFTVRECKEDMSWESFSGDCSAPFFPSSKIMHQSLVEKLCKRVLG